MSARARAVAVVAALAVVGGVVAAGGWWRGEEHPPPEVVDGTLTVGVVGLASLDPLEVREPVDMMVVDQIFDTLVAYDPETLEPRPYLASWQADAELSTFTFDLARDARFHDGAPVTSSDVKFTLERIARPGSGSPLAVQLDAVVGYAEYAVAGTADGLEGVQTPDPVTVVIRLDRPFAEFPAVLGHPGFGIVPQVAVAELGDDFRLRPVGSGSFEVATATDERIVVRRVEEHRVVPRLGAIEFVRFADTAAAYRSFVDGVLDVAPVPTEEAAAAAERFGTRGMGPYLGLVFYGMDLTSPDLADPRLRQAISLAIDRERIVREVYQGGVGVADGLVAEGVPGRIADACGARCRHDPAEARRLLAEAFDGRAVPEVPVDFDADATQTAVANSIKDDLDAVGIPSRLRPHPFEEYGRFLVSGEARLFRLGWIADYPSPGGFLGPLFQSDSAENLVGLADPQVDAGLAAAQREADPARRRERYRQVEQLVLDEFAVVPLAQLELRYVISDRVQALTLSPIGSFDAAAVALLAR